MAEPETEAPPKTEEKETRAPATREWEPFQTLRREIDRVFENFHEGPWRSTFGRARIDFEPFRLLTGSWPTVPYPPIPRKPCAAEPPPVCRLWDPHSGRIPSPRPTLWQGYNTAFNC